MIEESGGNVHIHEWKYATFHSKMCVADDFLTIVGSGNNDFSSSYTASEISVSIFDPGTAAAARAAAELDMTQSEEVSLATAQAWERWYNYEGDYDVLREFYARVGGWLIEMVFENGVKYLYENRLERGVLTH